MNKNTKLMYITEKIYQKVSKNDYTIPKNLKESKKMKKSKSPSLNN